MPANSPATGRRILWHLVLLIAVVGSGIMAERLAGGNIAVALSGQCPGDRRGAGGADRDFRARCRARISILRLRSISRLRGDMAWRVAALYMLAQIIAAILGVWLTHMMFAVPVLEVSAICATDRPSGWPSSSPPSDCWRPLRALSALRRPPHPCWWASTSRAPTGSPLPPRSPIPPSPWPAHDRQLFRHCALIRAGLYRRTACRNGGCCIMPAMAFRAGQGMSAFGARRTFHSSAPFAALPGALKASHGIFGGIGVNSGSAHFGHNKSRSQLPVRFLNCDASVAPRRCSSGLGRGGWRNDVGGTHT